LQRRPKSRLAKCVLTQVLDLISITNEVDAGDKLLAIFETETWTQSYKENARVNLLYAKI